MRSSLRVAAGFAAPLAVLALAACGSAISVGPADGEPASAGGTVAHSVVAAPSTAESPAPTSDADGAALGTTPAQVLRPAPTATPTATAANATAPRIPDNRGGGFVPLDDPAFVSAAEASFLTGDELVLGYADAAEARAYPVRMMRFHHIVNDTVGKGPLLITY